MSETNYEQYGGDGVNATFHGLHKWYEHEFKHLGWMILMKAKGNMLKLKCYEDSVNKLIMGLENKKNMVEDKDSREDLIILLANTKILQQFVNQHLMNTGENMTPQQQIKQNGQQGGRKSSRKNSRKSSNGSRERKGSRRGQMRDIQKRNY